MPNESNFDTRETREEEEAGKRILALAKSRSDDFVLKWESFDRTAGVDSSMAKVDLLLPYQPLSYQVANFISVACDNIRAVHNYIDKTNEIPMTALYSMIRSAIEATSYGIWILNAGKRDKQAFLSLRITYENNQDLEGLAKVLHPEEWKKRVAVEKRLIEIQRGLRTYSHRDITKRANTTDVIIEADRVLASRRTSFNGLQTWKTCSGIAHANSAVLETVLERRDTGKSDDIGRTVILTSRITFIAGFLLSAIENLEVLLEMYIKASATPRHSAGSKG